MQITSGVDVQLLKRQSFWIICGFYGIRPQELMFEINVNTKHIEYFNNTHTLTDTIGRRLAFCVLYKKLYVVVSV